MERPGLKLARKALMRLREGREAAGLSQAALAERIGVSPSYIGMLERAERLPSLDVLLAMCAAVGLTPSELFAELPQGRLPEQPELAKLRAVVERWPVEHQRVLVRVAKDLEKLRT